jgi:hypothetical protein
LIGERFFHPSHGSPPLVQDPILFRASSPHIQSAARRWSPGLPMPILSGSYIAPQLRGRSLCSQALRCFSLLPGYLPLGCTWRTGDKQVLGPAGKHLGYWTCRRILKTKQCYQQTKDLSTTYQRMLEYVPGSQNTQTWDVDS